MLSRKKKPQMAKRALAFEWQRIIFRCWQNFVCERSRVLMRSSKPVSSDSGIHVGFRPANG